jgi:alkylhydroperoxidase family enzyme
VTTDLLAARPELAEHRATLLDGIWRDSGVPPRLLELARLRVAALLHDEVGSATRTPVAVAAGFDEDVADALPSWPTDPRFTPTDRAALALAEQFVMDCHGITDAQVAQLRGALGDQSTVGFLVALALFDGFSRAATVLRGF